MSSAGSVLSFNCLLSLSPVSLGSVGVFKEIKLPLMMSLLLVVTLDPGQIVPSKAVQMYLKDINTASI